MPFDAVATTGQQQQQQQQGTGFGIDHWEAALKQQGEEGGADRAIGGVIFHYPAHFFAFFEVMFWRLVQDQDEIFTP